MKLLNFENKNSLINQYMYEMRSVEIQKDRMRFRRNIERIGEIFAYEISKELDYIGKKVTTPLGIKEVSLIENDMVIASIMRAGIPFHQGFLNYFDQADNAFISAYRKNSTEKEFKIQVDYVSTPDLNDKILILADPMLATAQSMVDVYNQLIMYGSPKYTYLASVISAQKGVEYITEKLDSNKVSLWTAAIDPDLNSKSYIVPGLGDAGDLAFGEKL